MQALDHHIAKDGFRLRGTAMSRVDAFSDVVFGFALTLLVVSLEVPHTYAELHESFRGFLPFAICFTLLIIFWYNHFVFFRRFGVEDALTITINAALLFVVLFFVYPLKFLFSLIVNGFYNGNNRVESWQMVELMTIYGLGYAAIYLLFTALNLNAYRQRARLALSPLETALTRTYIEENLGLALIGIISAILAHVLPPGVSGLAGFAYFLIPVFETVHGFRTGRRMRSVRAAAEAQPSLP